MFSKLITHSWQMMRRSAFFEKSIFVKGFIAFVLFFVAMQLYGMGRALPMILNEHLPQYPPAKWVYGLLPIILLSDLVVRLFFQKLPPRHVLPYLHLPISRGHLSGYRIFQSWLHPMNLYLLVFFYPFIQMTINPATSSQGLGVVGIFLLTGINQSILMLLRTPDKTARSAGILFGAALMIISAAYLWIPQQMLQYSLDVFLTFVHARPISFLIPVAIISGLQGIVYLQSTKSFYKIYESEEPAEKTLTGTRVERFLAAVPVYGPYWLLEWRLLIRNRRTRQSLYFFLPAAIAYALVAAFMINEPGDSGLAIMFVIIAGGLGNMHLQHAYSWESHFFDFLSSRDFSMEQFIRAKYYFYLIIAALQLVVVSIILLPFNIHIIPLFAATALFSAGLGFYLFLRAGVRHSSRMDLQGKASFNMEGVSGMKMLMGMLQIFIFLPLFIIGIFLPLPYGEGVLVGITGLIFLLSHKAWTRNLGRRLEARKHINLALYREK